MATYKVPQDVEADDKLIGPFSFRQFIYLIVVVLSLAAAWGLSMIFIGLAIIPLPITIAFAALALPLRKDQPMETYLAAMVQYFLKPRRRLWQSDGMISQITIDMPTQKDSIRLKDITGADASLRFDYLAQVADTRGWSTRGVTDPTGTIADSSYDVLDDTSDVAKSFNGMLATGNAQRKDALLQRIHNGSIVDEVTPAPAPASMPADLSTKPAFSEPKLVYNPYPISMQQTIIQPARNFEAPSITPALTPEISESKPVMPSVITPSPAIISLAQDDSGLSIETIAKEARRIEELRESEGEVVINLH